MDRDNHCMQRPTKEGTNRMIDNEMTQRDQRRTRIKFRLFREGRMPSPRTRSGILAWNKMIHFGLVQGCSLATGWKRRTGLNKTDHNKCRTQFEFIGRHKSSKTKQKQINKSMNVYKVWVKMEENKNMIMNIKNENKLKRTLLICYVKKLPFVC